MGYGFTDALEEADFIIYNTCAVRENAEKRVFGFTEYGDIIPLLGCRFNQKKRRAPWFTGAGNI